MSSKASAAGGSRTTREAATADGRSLPAALRYLAPFADPAKQWPKQEIEAAGFKLVAEGDFLHHAEDPKDIPVFKAAVPIDEFVLKYQKPQ
jgi:predicted methyltransferase